MHKKAKALIIVSYLLQTLLGLLNIVIIFLDSSPNLGEKAVFFGLIFIVHGLAISLHDKKKLKKSYLSIVLGYAVSAIILSFQDLFPNWFVTGMGGISLIDSVVALIWPAIVSLTTVILLQRHALKSPKTPVKKLMTYLACTWIALLIAAALFAPAILYSDSSFIGFLITPLSFIFYLIFPAGGLFGGGIIFLALSLYLIK